MTDAIRDAAIEAALSAYRASTSDDVREVLSAAIAAYERAMWRPIAEAPKHTAVIIASGRTIAEAFQESNGQWNTEFARYSPTHFRPLPAPPEDAE